MLSTKDPFGDWITRARYVADVALGRRMAYPDIAVVAEWVALNFNRDLTAETVEKRGEWVNRYMSAHE
jgi:hypothetical protein